MSHWAQGRLQRCMQHGLLHGVCGFPARDATQAGIMLGRLLCMEQRWNWWRHQLVAAPTAATAAALPRLSECKRGEAFRGFHIVRCARLKLPALHRGLAARAQHNAKCTGRRQGSANIICSQYAPKVKWWFASARKACSYAAQTKRGARRQLQENASCEKSITLSKSTLAQPCM